MAAKMSSGAVRPLVVIRGRGTVPAEFFGPITISWPHAFLQADDRGVQVDLSLSAKIPPFDPIQHAHRFPFTWTCRWSEMAGTISNGSSVVLLSKFGRGCRFVGGQSWRVLALAHLAQQHGVEDRAVVTTLPYLSRI